MVRNTPSTGRNSRPIATGFSSTRDDPYRWAGQVGVGGSEGMGNGPVRLGTWLRGEAMGRARAIGRSTYGSDLRPEAEVLPPNKSTDLRQPGGLTKPAAKPTGPAGRKRSQ